MRLRLVLRAFLVTVGLIQWQGCENTPAQGVYRAQSEMAGESEKEPRVLLAGDGMFDMDPDTRRSRASRVSSRIA
jgi:hypothetical protein